MEYKTNSNSFWISSINANDYPSLNKDIKTDIVIIGGGITGITCGILLKKSGFNVVLIDKDKIGHGATGHSTAKITSQHYLIYDKLIRQFGREMALQYASANQNAISLIYNLIKEYKVDCNFVNTSAYIFTKSDKYIKKIENEAEAASNLGIKADYINKVPLPFDIKCAVEFKDQAQFHPLRYIYSISKAINKEGSFVFENSKAIDIDEGEKCKVILENGNNIICDYAIVATQYPFYDGYGLYFTRLYPERSYVIAIDTKESYENGIYINAEDPGRSIRAFNDDKTNLLLIGGESHRTGYGENMNEHYLNLKNYAKENFNVDKIRYKWSTQDYKTPDGIPYIGLISSKSKKVYVATGFDKWGMTNGAVAGLVLNDIITKGKSQYEEVFNPSRFTPVASFKNFIVENTMTAGEYIALKIKPAEDEYDLKNDEAKIVNIDGKKAGAYRDENGKLHLIDITCTHLGCELKWNNAEKTWDCPCHGSRFTIDGEVINGPALKKCNSYESLNSN